MELVFPQQQQGISLINHRPDPDFFFKFPLTTTVGSTLFIFPSHAVLVQSVIFNEGGHKQSFTERIHLPGPPVAPPAQEEILLKSMSSSLKSMDSTPTAPSPDHNPLFDGD